MHVREGIIAFEQCATIFATAVAYANAQNATFQGSKTYFQAQLQQREADINTLTMQMHKTYMQMQAQEMMNNLKQQAMSNHQQQPSGGRNRGRSNNNSKNNSNNNKKQEFGAFQMTPAPTTWQTPMQKIMNTCFYGKTGNTLANRWNNGVQCNNNGGKNNNHTRFGEKAQQSNQYQWQG